MTNNLQVTHENFEEVLLTVVIGNIALQNYSEHFGISSSNLKLADSSCHLMQKLVEVIVDSGNSIYSMVQPTFVKFGYNCDLHYDEKDFAHISEITPFDVEIPDGLYVFGVCENIEANVNEDYTQFLADNKLR